MPVTAWVDQAAPVTTNPAHLPVAVDRIAVDVVTAHVNVAPTTGQLWPRVTQR